MPQALRSDSSASVHALVSAAPVTCAGADAWAATVVQEVLAATYWFDPGERGKPYSASIKFSGRRLGITGKPQPGDYFSHVETVEGIVPGSGPLALTTRASGINPGEWMLSAEPVSRNGGARMVRSYQWSHHGGPRKVKPALWYWRKPVISPDPPRPVKTGLVAFARIPGVIPGAWPALVALGVLVGLAVQAMLVARAGLDVRAALMVSLAASLAGLIGAKVWYLALNQHSWRAVASEGLCIQGFLVGAVAVGTAALALAHLPVWTFLDVTAPGLFFGMAIGRHGCFFGGCCAGRATASRLGMWTSDRRVGARRIPTQLMESLVCLALGFATLVMILYRHPPIAGAAFVGAVAVYTLWRQVLLPLRAEPRKTSLGRPLTMATAALVLIADLVLSAVA